jgi:hypothetical protein
MPTSPQPLIRRSLIRAWKRARAKTKAVEAARERADDLSREQLRVVLEDEMAHRDIANDPLWFENRLDILEATRIDRIRRGWLALTNVATALRRPIPPPASSGRAQPLSLPLDPQQPCDQSLYHVGPLGDEWTVVELDPAMRGVLDHVHVSPLDKVGQIAAIRVCLAWEEESSLAQSNVAVQIGSEHSRVGTLSADATEYFRPALLAAAACGQVATMTGYLAPAVDRQPPYLLTLHLPVRRMEP